MSLSTPTPTATPTRSRRRTPGPALAAVLAVGLLATGCGTVTPADAGGAEDAADGDGASYPVTGTTCGREISVPAAPQRVVSLHPSITELLIQLGVGDRVVAQAQDALGEPSPELAEQVDAIPSLSSDSPPDKETLVSQTPDLVLSGTEYEFNTEMGFAGYDDLADLGAVTYVATGGCADRRTAGTVEDAFADVAFLGEVFGVEERAAELEEQARAALAEVAASFEGEAPVRAAQVYVEAGKVYAIGGAIEVDVLRLAGGENVWDSGDGLFADFFAAEVGPEAVLAEDPEAFVFAVNSPEHEQETIDYLTSTFPESRAVRDGRLVAVDNTFIQPGTLAAVEGVRDVAAGLHP